MTMTSADRIFGAVALRKDLLTEAQFQELTRVLEHARNEGKALPIETVATELGLLNNKEIALIFKIRRRYARLCSLCGQVTYILPEETSSTPCEFCGPIDPDVSEWALTESEAYYIGKRIGDYTPMDKGGEERGAKVYLARRDDENRLYVLKVLSIEVKDRVALTRFIREVDICRNIRHPNVVSVVDAGEFEGRRYLVLEYVEGQSLIDRLEEQGPLPWEDALDILLQVCKGLALFHDMGVIHRDVKP
ncbi:MAG: protein kinase, partial [Planctomycetota bacterium]|nr:protein kinase [Planctomycetota bacterium]